MEAAIKARCEGQASCTITGDTFRTNDPCPNILKELRVDYKCQAGEAQPGMLCMTCVQYVDVQGINSKVLQQACVCSLRRACTMQQGVCASLS
jgi:hypothetical protein